MTAPRARIGLGTIDFGIDTADAERAEIAAILESAARHQVDVIDTAAVYGDSEIVLGQTLPAAHQFRIITKTPPLRESVIGSRQIELVRSAFERSLGRLDVSCVDGLLVHHANDLLTDGGDWLWEVLCEFKEQGRVRKIGVTVENMDQLPAIRNEHEIDLVQLPLSILDQRALRGGQLTELREAGVEVQARSPFFHGLLLTKAGDLPEQYEPLRSQLERYHQFRLKHNLTAVKAALSFVLRAPVDCVIVGAASIREFSAVMKAADSLPEQLPDFSAFACEDMRILNSTRWAA